MTTPNQAAPDGAVTIGGGTWNYGQTMTEDIGRAAFEFPMPTFDNMLDLLRLVLERLPIDALQPWADFLGIVDGVFSSAGQAVDAIIGALVENVGMTVQAFGEWLADTFQPVKDWLDSLQPLLDWLGTTLSTAMQTVFQTVLDFFDWVGSTIGVPDMQTILSFFSGQLGGLGSLDIFGSVAAFFTDLLTNLGSGVWAWLQEVASFFDWVWGLLGEPALTAITNLLDSVGGLLSFPAIQGHIEDLAAFFTGVLNPAQFVQVVKDAFPFLEWLFLQFTGAVDSVLKPVFTFLDWLWTSFGATAETFLKPALDFFNWVWGLFGEPALTDLGNLFNSIMGMLSFSSIQTFIEDIADFFTGLLNPSQFVQLFKDAFSFLDWLFNTLFSGTVDTLENIFTALQGLLDPAGTLTSWLEGIPSLAQSLINQLWSLLNGGAEGINRTINEVLVSIGDFVSDLIKFLTGNPLAVGLGEVATWANSLLTKGLSWPDFKTLFGEIPNTILGVIPLPAISMVSPELMAHGGFDTSSTLDPASGWEWSTDTQSGSAGSAKVAGNSEVRRLYSNQTIAVAELDKLNISWWKKTTGTIPAGGVEFGVVYLKDGVVLGDAVISVSSGSATWTNHSTTYTIPDTGADINGIRIFIGIKNTVPAGSYVWFDDISVKKTGLLDGSWMEGQLGTIAQDIQGVVDQVVQGIQGLGAVGALVGDGIKGALQSIFTTLFGPLQNFLPTNLVLNPFLETAIPGLQASKITSGDFDSTRIRNGAITTLKISDLAVSEAKLNGGAVTANKIATSAVTTEKINPYAVTTEKIAPWAVTSGEVAENAVTNFAIASNAVNNDSIAADAVTSNEILNGTITSDLLNTSTFTAIADTIGVTPVTGSGGKMSRKNTATKVTCSGGDNKFPSNFFIASGGGSGVDQISADIAADYTTGKFTVTHAGYYIVEVGFTVNASAPGVTYFNVAPALFVDGSTAPFKVGADSLGSYGAGFGNWSRSAHATFIVYLGANGHVQPGYRNFSASSISNFFQGDAAGNTTYFSIAMLNRTAEG